MQGSESYGTLSITREFHLASEWGPTVHSTTDNVTGMATDCSIQRTYDSDNRIVRHLMANWHYGIV